MTDLCNDVEKFGKGIGSVPRYRIVEALFSGGKTVTELVKKTKLSQSLVSQHLRVLKEAQLVQDERRGQEVVYTLNNKHMISLLQRLTQELKPPKKH
ncbi:MAG TPA: metalloregulator ArsR/SmtB family transcription factor [Candidatus Paceibacterota bacterium]